MWKRFQLLALLLSTVSFILPPCTNAFIKNEYDDIIIATEIVPHTEYSQGFYDYVEFFNQGDKPVNISGWFVTDSGSKQIDKAEKYTIPVGTVMQPGTFYVVTEKELKARFKSAGEKVRLQRRIPDSLKNGTWDYDVVVKVDAYAAVNHMAVSRWVNSIGKEYWPHAFPTEKYKNRYPMIGPFVISEVGFSPPDGMQYVKITCIRPTGDETNTGVMIIRDQISGKAYQLRFKAQINDSLDPLELQNQYPPAFWIPANLRITVGSSVIITSTSDIAGFKSTHNMTNVVDVLGPWSGKLNSTDDTVTLYGLDNAIFYYESVRISNDSKNWRYPKSGILRRLSLTSFGHEPENWRDGAENETNCNPDEGAHSCSSAWDACTAARCIEKPGCSSNSVSIQAIQYAEEQINGTVVLTGQNLDFGSIPSGPQTVAFRFKLDSALSKAVYIKAATLNVSVSRQQTGVVNLLLNFENTNNSKPFNASAKNISSRAITTSGVSWNINEEWPVGTIVKTPDFSGNLRKIIDRADFAAGNFATLLISANGPNANTTRRTFTSDLDKIVLNIEYRPKGCSGYCQWSSIVCEHPNFAECYPTNTCLGDPTKNGYPANGCTLVPQVFRDIKNFGWPQFKCETWKSVDCQVSSWSKWTPCPPCGSVSTRERKLMFNSTNGGQCPPLKETKQCTPCPIDCKWKEWSTWSTCRGDDAWPLCLNGTSTRSRAKNESAHGGKDCVGSAEEARSCSIDGCAPTAPDGNIGLLPVAMCWTKSKSDWKAYFTYLSAATSSITIPVGPRNMVYVDGKPLAQRATDGIFPAQPTNFFPDGEQNSRKMFRVIRRSSGGEAQWHLDGKQSSSITTNNQAQRCASRSSAVIPVKVETCCTDNVLPFIVAYVKSYASQLEPSLLVNVTIQLPTKRSIEEIDSAEIFKNSDLTVTIEEPIGSSGDNLNAAPYDVAYAISYDPSFASSLNTSTRGAVVVDDSRSPTMGNPNTDTDGSTSSETLLIFGMPYWFVIGGAVVALALIILVITIIVVVAKKRRRAPVCAT